ncbi:MAG: hypothetical protein LIP77_06025 [Planctomycetes bacterium]|nr:hypothetical protein [Planctomycetota bacterium]
MSSKKEALGLYMRDTARKLTSTARTIRILMLLGAMIQAVWAVVVGMRMSSVGGPGFILLPILVIAVIGLCGTVLLANFIRFSSDLLAMISLKLVENEITEREFEYFPAIPGRGDGSSSAGDTRPEAAD